MKTLTSHSVYCSNALLPSEYQAVEWLESDGNAWIFTGIACSKKSVEMKCRVAWLAGAYAKLNAMGADYGGGHGLDHHVWTWSQVQPEANKFYDWCFTNVNGTRTVHVDGQQITTGSNLVSRGYKIAVFASWNDEMNGVAYTSIYRISWFGYWNDDVQVLDLHPCCRKSDKAPGMYDTLSQKFFTNAGQGTFTCGPHLK